LPLSLIPALLISAIIITGFGGTHPLGGTQLEESIRIDIIERYKAGEVHRNLLQLILIGRKPTKATV
jgi:hypothetical protein